MMLLYYTVIHILNGNGKMGWLRAATGIQASATVMEM
jgi:hypothetical protein